jgi:hypothetical protein
VPSVSLPSYSLNLTPPPPLHTASEPPERPLPPNPPSPRRSPAPRPDVTPLPTLQPSPELLSLELTPHREAQACGAARALHSIEKLKHVVMLVHFAPPRSSSIRACALPLLCIINNLPLANGMWRHTRTFEVAWPVLPTSGSVLASSH